MSVITICSESYIYVDVTHENLQHVCHSSMKKLNFIQILNGLYTAILKTSKEHSL